MRKLSLPQREMLENCVANGGTWLTGGKCDRANTRRSLEDRGFITYRRYMHNGGSRFTRHWAWAITITDAGREALNA